MKLFIKNFALNCIREFFNFAETLILFIFKKNNNLRLYVNYRNLNIIIIKNKCFFSLIEKTLNRLIDVMYFTKLNLKNAYYYI